MPIEIFIACNQKDGIDVRTYEALHTTLDLEDLYAILEMKQSRDSWLHAEAINSDVVELRHNRHSTINEICHG